MNLIDFIDVVEEEGIVAALENYLTNIFRDEAIRVINQRGGIADFLTGDAEMIQEGGIWLKKINITDNDKLYLNPDTDDIVGRDYGNVRERGQYGANTRTGGFGLVNGMIEETTPEGTRMVYYISNSTVIDKMEVYGTSGTHVEIIATNPETGLKLNEKGMPIGAIVLDFEKGKIYEYESTGNSVDFEIIFKDPSVNINNVVNINLAGLSEKEKQDVLNYYMLSNGINNKNPYGSPSYMKGFLGELKGIDAAFGEGLLIPLYNEFVGRVVEKDFYSLGYTLARELVYCLLGYGYIDGDGIIKESFFVLDGDYTKMDLGSYNDYRQEVYDIMWAKCDHLLEDVFKWLVDVYGDTQEVTNDQVTDLIVGKIKEAYQAGYPVDLVGFCYSGAGDPYIQAINKQVYGAEENAYLDVKSIVMVGTPMKKISGENGETLPGRIIENPNVETVISVVGENDVFDNILGATPDPGYFKIGSQVPNEYNIVIKDCGHGDYFYDPQYPSDNDEFKIKVARFIAEITARSRDVERLSLYLNKPGIFYNSVTQSYEVDINLIVLSN